MKVIEKLTFGLPLSEEELHQDTINLQSTPVTSLPDGLVVLKNLILNYTNIKQLPKGLKVGWNLYIKHSPIHSLPDDLIVMGNIFTEVDQIKNCSEHLAEKITNE